jgi:hypothetical protein
MLLWRWSHASRLVECSSRAWEVCARCGYAPVAGASGGGRVIYYFHSEVMPVYLIALFAKNEKTDLTPAERKVLVRLVEVLKRSHGVEK